jgi:DNA-binding response OmpR family regulator
VQPRILVVDDSATIRADLRTLLIAASFAVTTSETKAAAQRALKADRFELVILDVILPDGNGTEILREIRLDPKLRATPVILLSSETDVHNILRGQGISADWYVAKPYDAAALIRRIGSLVGVRDATRKEGSGPPSGKRILLVGDDATFLAAAADQLQREGHDVLLARSGAEAIQVLAVQTVDHVVLELVMPGLDGIETCRRLKRLGGRQSVPVTLFSATDDAAARGQALAAGAEDFLIKGQGIATLRVRLRGGAPPARRPAPSEGEPGPPSSGPVSAPASRPSMFAQIVAASGLSTSVGRGTLERACRRAGIEPDQMSCTDLPSALPAIRDALAVFYDPTEVARRVSAISAIARLARGAKS